MVEAEFWQAYHAISPGIPAHARNITDIEAGFTGSQRDLP